MANTDNIYYFPWVRKGLSNRLLEKDFMGAQAPAGLSSGRAALEVRQEFEVTGADGETSRQSESRVVELLSPGDIISVSPQAILRCVPDAENDKYPVDFYPYIEFWEPDFLWRYTPAAVAEDRLRPWLALVACRNDRFKIGSGPHGHYVTFTFPDESSWQETFLPTGEFWKCAHAQGFAPETPEFCRLMALRTHDKLEPDTDYTVFLLPAFETGRLKGLGEPDELIAKTIAQQSSWENSLEEQRRNRKRPFDFPVYHRWSFKTGRESFDALVEKLKVFQPTLSTIKTDVTAMGEGLDYRLFAQHPGRTSVGVPGATACLGYGEEKGFPAPEGGEKILRDRMKSLLDQNPVFAENMELLHGSEGVEAGDDDPMVVPPVYGAKHVMATSLDERKCAAEGMPWLTQLNLEVQHRAVAGLGKRTVQLNQEEFMNRAWKQVEAVNALNMELYRRLVSHEANRKLGHKVVDQTAGPEKYIATLMQYLSSIRNVQAGKDSQTTLSEILQDSSIPRSFASATFRNLTDSLKRMIPTLDTDTLLEKIVSHQLFLSPYRLQPEGTVLPADLRQAVQNLRQSAHKVVCNEYLAPFIYSETGADFKTHGYFTEEIFDNPLDTSEGSLHYKATRMKILPDIYKYYREAVLGPSLCYFTDRDYFTRENLLAHFQRLEEARKDLGQFTTWGTGVLDGPEGPYLINLLMLDDEQFYSWFGKDCNLAIVLHRLALVPRKEMLELIESNTQPEVWTDDMGREHQRWKHPYLKARMKGRDSRLLAKKPLSYLLGVGSVDSMTPDFHDRFESALRYNQFSDRQILHFRELHEFWLDFLYTPDHIQQLQFNRMNGLRYQWISTMEDFESVLAQQSPDKALNLAALDDLLEYADRLEADLKKAAAARQEPAPVAPEKVTEIRHAFQDEEAWQRMVDVASRWYEKFFERSGSGQRLREEYMDELLRSRYPVLAYPVFPEPVYHYAKQFSEKFILPCAHEQVRNSVAVMESNPAFVEAYLSGMNTELAREMLWREYPTDERGSYFRKFWDSETSEQDIEQMNFFDVKPMHLWKGNLGENHEASKTGMVIFSVKGDLMVSYPDTRIFLQRAVLSRSGQGGTVPQVTLDNSATLDNGGILQPVLEAYLGKDIYIVGFKTSLAHLLGDPAHGDYGYCLAFSEDVEDLNFYNKTGDRAAGADNAAQVAQALKDRPTTYGKHISFFL